MSLYEKFSIHPSWKPLLEKWFKSDWLKVKQVLNHYIQNKIPFAPKSSDIFRAFSIPRGDVKVIMIGEQPTKEVYDKQKVATGLFGASAFSDMISWSDETDMVVENLAWNYQVPFLGVEGQQQFDHTLSHWQKQGVLLLNCALTTPINKAINNLPLWKNFIHMVVSDLSINTGLVWVLFGKNAHQLEQLIDEKLHWIIKEDLPANTMKFLVKRNKGLVIADDDFRKSDVFIKINEILCSINGNGEGINWLE